MAYTYKSYPRISYDYGFTGVPPMVLIDRPVEEIVETQAWVEVCEECVCPEQAQRIIERSFPIEDRPEGEDYLATGAQVWLKPIQMDGFVARGYRQYWELARPGEHKARLFWTVRVVCPI